MLERDDEDLAIDQLVEAGRADDPQLTQPAVEPLQEQAPEQAETPLPEAGRSALSQLREQIDRIRSQLESLPTVELEQLDELDTRGRELTERRDLLRSSLERLPAPQERRFGRGEDPHIVDRTRLASALAGAEDQLERVLTQRATVGRQLGDVTAVGQERDGLAAALRTLERQHTELRNDLADREVGRRPQWAGDALGERPERPADAERWDRAARTMARYRIEYEIPDGDTPLGREPAGGEQRGAYHQADLAREELGRELGREATEHDLGPG
jgi:small-conductance mechanosensitive channel